MESIASSDNESDPQAEVALAAKATESPQQMALALRRAGYSVIPVALKANSGKRPKQPHVSWKDYESRLADESQINQWFDIWPAAGVAIVCGPLSGVACIDVDPRNDGVVVDWEDVSDVCEDTLSGGLHAFVQHTDEIAQAKGCTGVDVKVRGYVIIGPSTDGARRYTWRPGAVAKLLARQLPDPYLATERLRERRAAELAGSREAVGGDWIAETLRTPVPMGGQREAILRLAGYYAAKGEPEDITTGLLCTIVSTWPQDPSDLWTDEQIVRIVGDIYAKDVERHRTRGHVHLVDDSPVPGLAKQIGGFTLTDLGNARRFVRSLQETVAWVPAWGWLAFDGKRWRRGADPKVRALAQQTVVNMDAEAAPVIDKSDRDDLVRHAQASEASFRITAMLTEARALLALRPEDFDRDPWLLTCLSGTLDLRTGEQREHQATDRITRLAPVEFDPEAREETWDRYLDVATGGDDELRRFLQRAVGYSLTGNTREEVLFFCYGPAASGKSTFIEAVKATLGDYATTADFDTFLTRKVTGGPRNDIARLAGTRFVSSVEVDDGRHIAEALIKQLTGGDTTAARFLHCESFEFVPQFKLWLAANYRPMVSGDDDAIWRRILQVPLDHQVPEDKRDPQVKATLRDPRAAGPAILAWALEGCLAWQRDGLGVPPKVKAATAEYRAEMDSLGRFLREACILDAAHEVTARELYGAYVCWCEGIGERPRTQKAVGKHLSHLGLSRKLLQGRTIWQGIGLNERAKNVVPPALPQTRVA